jgi:hypothetical protein
MAPYGEARTSLRPCRSRAMQVVDSCEGGDGRGRNLWSILPCHGSGMRVAQIGIRVAVLVGLAVCGGGSRASSAPSAGGPVALSADGAFGFRVIAPVGTPSPAEL